MIINELTTRLHSIYGNKLNYLEFKEFQDELYIVGFVGTISTRSIDLLLLDYLSKHCPNYLFLLVGPCEEELKQLIKSRNVVVLPPVEGEYIPTIIHLFDVGFIPYIIDNSDMDYVFPRKACEYLACGIPVVSTALNEIRLLEPYVCVASDYYEFAYLLKKSESDKYTPSSRIEFVKQYDWDVLINNLLRHLENEHISKDIVFISSIRWDYSWHRQQEMMSKMADHGYRVLFVEPCRNRKKGEEKIQEIRRNVWRIASPGLPYERCLYTVNYMNGVVSCLYIKHAVNQLKFDNPILWMDRVHGFLPSYYFKNHYVIYDLIDEILAFGRYRNERLLIGIENTVLKRADLLLSSSRTLLERKIQQSGRQGENLFIPNGLDLNRFL